jgi:hypothetical protein
MRSHVTGSRLLATWGYASLLQGSCPICPLPAALSLYRGTCGGRGGYSPYGPTYWGKSDMSLMSFMSDIALMGDIGDMSLMGVRGYVSDMYPGHGGSPWHPPMVAHRSPQRPAQRHRGQRPAPDTPMPPHRGAGGAGAWWVGLAVAATGRPWQLPQQHVRQPPDADEGDQVAGGDHAATPWRRAQVRAASHARTPRTGVRCLPR